MIRMEPTWLEYLKEEFDKPYMESLKLFLKEEKHHFLVYPPSHLIFNAFELSPFDSVKVVILGQDPYHGTDQAHGISFSVPDGMPLPPSLQNIKKELASDLSIPETKNGNLTQWAKQGVFMLNATLTVRAHAAGSHQRKGWETFTDKVIQILSEHRDNLVFILWGNYAQSKVSFIDSKKHFVISSSHPSPFSAHRGFLGSKPFSKTNQYLNSKGLETINWGL
jgi:uracil-DNA glycosylase